MDIIDQLYNSHVSAATLDALDKYRIHKDQALHGYHALKEQLTDDQAAALEQIMDENLMGTYKIYLKRNSRLITFNPFTEQIRAHRPAIYTSSGQRCE